MPRDTWDGTFNGLTQFERILAEEAYRIGFAVGYAAFDKSAGSEQLRLTRSDEEVFLSVVRRKLKEGARS